MHSGGYTPAESPVLANNIFHLANRTLPSLAIVDGYEGMEGDGPIGEPSWGDTVSPVAHRIALAGTDPVAVDAVGFALMGIRPEHTYYVYLCGAAGLGNYSLSNIAILGPDITSHIIPYRMHRTFDEQIAWIPTAVAARSSPAVQGISPFLGAERTDRRAGRVLFTFALPYNTEARLSVCTLHARQVREIAWPHYAPGRYSLWWDGRDDYGSPVATGNYMAVLKTGTGTAHHPVVWRRP